MSSHLFADTPHALKLIEDFEGYAQVNAPIAFGATKLPLILFSHGLGDPPVFYTSLLEDLASHGYIVIAVQHTYGCEPALLAHDKIVPMPIELAEFYKERVGSLEQALDHEHDIWTEDLLYVIDFLKKTEHADACANLCDAIDFDNIGIFGHSFGGSAATTLSRISDDVKAVADLDGVLWGSYWTESLVKPALFIMAGTLPTEDELLAAGFSLDQWERIMARSPQPLFEQAQCDAFYITIKSAEHMTFNDLYHLKNIGKPGDVSYENDMKLTRSLLQDFFDTYLKGKEPKLHELIKQNCENVIFQERQQLLIQSF